jgi:hypothetical protein
MVDVLEGYAYFKDKYQALPSEIVFEERNDNDASRCKCCGDRGVTYSAMVFSRSVFNENYDAEVLAWRKAIAERDQLVQAAALKLKIENDSKLARLAWKGLHRQERITRKDLGRSTLLRG